MTTRISSIQICEVCRSTFSSPDPAQTCSPECAWVREACDILRESRGMFRATVYKCSYPDCSDCRGHEEMIHRIGVSLRDFSQLNPPFPQDIEEAG